MKKNIYIVIVILLVLAAIFLRLYRFEGFVTYLGDQGRDAMIMHRIVTAQDFPAIGAPSSVGQVYLGPFYYYLVAPFLLLSGFNPVGPAYGVALLSIFGLVIAFMTIKKIIDTQTAILFLAFMTFSYPLVELSRFSWNPNLLPFFSFFSIHFFYLWLQDNKLKYAILFGSFLALMIQLHYLALLVFIPIGIVFLVKARNFTNKSRTIYHLGASMGSFLFFSLPLILFEFRHDFLNSRNFMKMFVSGEIESDKSYAENLIETIDQFFYHALQLDTSQTISIVIFLILIVAAIRIALVYKSDLLLLHFLNFFIFILGFALLDSARHLHYYGPAFLSFFLLVSMLPVILIRNNRIRFLAVALFIWVYASTSLRTLAFINGQPNNQIQRAEKIADSFKPHIEKQPIQIVPIPFTESDGHYRYFLQVDGYDILSHDSAEQPAELFVMCFIEECTPLGDPQWQIAAFENKTLDTSWKVEGVTIYKIIHGMK